MTVYTHICEVCGKTEDLDDKVSFQAGWDYPPRMGVFKTLSPRTCPDCPMQGSLWWRIITEGPDLKLTEKDEEFIKRVNSEPESILPVIT